MDHWPIIRGLSHEDGQERLAILEGFKYASLVECTRITIKEIIQILRMNVHGSNDRDLREIRLEHAFSHVRSRLLLFKAFLVIS